MLYITEAHASDVWPLKFSYERPRPKSEAERVRYAREYADEVGFVCAGFKLLVDRMDNAGNNALGAWPTSYFVLDRFGQLAFIGQASASDHSYDVRGIVRFVQRLARGQGPL